MPEYYIVMDSITKDGAASICRRLKPAPDDKMKGLDAGLKASSTLLARRNKKARSPPLAPHNKKASSTLPAPRAVFFSKRARSVTGTQVSVQKMDANLGHQLVV